MTRVTLAVIPFVILTALGLPGARAQARPRRTFVARAGANDASGGNRPTSGRASRLAQLTLAGKARDAAIEEQMRRGQPSQQTLVLASIWTGIIAFFALSALF